MSLYPTMSDLISSEISDCLCLVRLTLPAFVAPAQLFWNWGCSSHMKYEGGQGGAFFAELCTDYTHLNRLKLIPRWCDCCAVGCHSREA